MPGGWVTLQDTLYRCTVDAELFGRKIGEARELADRLCPVRAVIATKDLTAHKEPLGEWGWEPVPGSDKAACQLDPALRDRLKELKVAYETDESGGGAGSEFADQVEAIERWYLHDWTALDAKLRTSIVEGISVFLSLFDQPQVAGVFCPPPPDPDESIHMYGAAPDEDAEAVRPMPPAPAATAQRADRGRQGTRRSRPSARGSRMLVTSTVPSGERACYTRGFRFMFGCGSLSRGVQFLPCKTPTEAPMATVAMTDPKTDPKTDHKMADQKQKSLSTALSQIERSYGKGAIMRMGADGTKVFIEAISTGALNLDAAIGIGGLPRGRMSEIYGPESSGKTTLCLHVIANAQRKGGIAAFIDVEHALDVGYARRLGVDVDNLLVSQPDTGEQALEITEVLIRSNAVDVVVIDSVAALVPRAEIEGEMGDSHVGLQARLMSQALRKLTGAVSRSNTAVIFTNQIRERIGVMFGNPETTSGGRALKFYASCRLDIRRIGAIKDGQEVVGNRTRVKVVKNKCAPPFKQAEFDILYDEGISHTSLLIDLGSELSVVEKSGAWYSYGDLRLGQGKENARQFLVDNPDVADEIDGQVRAALEPERESSSRAGDEGRDED